MNFIENVYTYKIKDRKVDKVIAKMNKGKFINKLYVITYPLVDDGLLEIYDYNQLLQPYYRKISDEITVVGISKGKAGAQEIILQIIQNMCDEGLMDFGQIRKFIEGASQI